MAELSNDRIKSIAETHFLSEDEVRKVLKGKSTAEGMRALEEYKKNRPENNKLSDAIKQKPQPILDDEPMGALPDPTEPTGLADAITKPEKEEKKPSLAEAIQPVAPAAAPSLPSSRAGYLNKVQNQDKKSMQEAQKATDPNKAAAAANKIPLPEEVEQDPENVKTADTVSVLEGQIKELNDQLTGKDAEKLDLRRKQAIMELTKAFSNAMGKYAAARYGLKHNVNMAGFKGTDINIAAIMAPELEDLNQQVAKITGKRDKKANQLIQKLQQLADIKSKKEAATTAFEREKELTTYKTDEDIRKAEKIAKYKKVKGKAGGGTGTGKQFAGKLTGEFGKKLGRELGAGYADWLQTGQDNYLANSEATDSAIAILEDSDIVIGGPVGIVPHGIRALGAELAGYVGFERYKEGIYDGMQVENMVRSVIVKNLKDTLGAQFTEKEGEKLLSSYFATTVPKKRMIENAKRIQRNLDRANNAKVRIKQHLEKHRNLDSYTGPTPKEAFYGRSAGELVEIGKEEKEKKAAETITKPKLSPEDQAALKWANKNPDDPRAEKIKKKLGR